MADSFADTHAPILNGDASGHIIAPVIDAGQFQVKRIRPLRGPNYWRLAPVIACEVSLGSLEDLTSADMPGFNERLLAALPSLQTHPCSRGTPGGFVERLMEGTYIPHILEHVALELQSLAGGEVVFGRMMRSGDERVWWVIVEYEEEEVGVESIHEAANIIRACITGDEIKVNEIVEDLQSLHEEVRLGPSTGSIVEEARRRGIPVRRLNSRSLVRLGLGRHLQRVQATMSDRTSAIAVEIAQNKEETKRVLRDIGLPVPRGGVVRSMRRAFEAAEDIGYPVILKPLDASHGRGVSARLDNVAALQEAWGEAARISSRVIVERYYSGRDHRILVVGGRFVACAERVPAHVVGDGTSTIRELIEQANRDPRRGVGHRRTLTLLPTDDLTVEQLARSGFTFESVPAHGEPVLLRSTANLSTGGTAIDRTDEIHAANITSCEMAAGAVGLDIAGIDVLSDDISVPFGENDAVILEVNAAPGIRMHTHPTEGASRNVASPIIDMLYPPGSDTSIPVIAVTGTNGKTTTVRLIAHLFRNTGHHVGFTTTDGVYVQNRRVMEGDMTGSFGANIILSNRAIDVAVLETARGGLLRSGLGFDECDVGVVLNVAADHLAMGGINSVEQLAQLKGVVAAVVKRDGHAVLNADDPLVYNMRARTTSDVVLFSTREMGENPLVETHTARGGISACLRHGQFVIRRGRLQIAIADEREVPLMLGGAAHFQRQNILAAALSAYVQGIRYDDIRGGLLSFFPSPALTPGRLNLIRLRTGARVLVDYAHNPHAIAGLVDFVNNLPARRRIAIIGVPGDRRDVDILEAGRLCARFNHVIVKEDVDLRGRQPGETAALLQEGLRAGGADAAEIEFVPDELEAVRGALSLLAEDDVLVVLADKVSAVLAAVKEVAEVR